MAYIGKVCWISKNEKFAYIDRKSISEELNSAKDIFIAQEECPVKLRLGQKLQFELLRDERRKNAFRAAVATEYFTKSEQIIGGILFFLIIAIGPPLVLLFLALIGVEDCERNPYCHISSFEDPYTPVWEVSAIWVVIVLTFSILYLTCKKK